jgi:hypothetical protein
MVVVYDRYFNQNEYFVITTLVVGLVLFIKCKKIFSKKETIVFFLLPIFLGLLLDHTISIPPFDFYDVNDTSKFEITDFLTYLMYGPYGYFFIHFYKRFGIKNSLTPVYILLWSIISISLEYIACRFGVFHYKNGYQIFFSFPIYLLVLSFKIMFYKYLMSHSLGGKASPHGPEPYREEGAG